MNVPASPEEVSNTRAASQATGSPHGHPHPLAVGTRRAPFWARSLLHKLISRLGIPGFQVELWDGTRIQPIPPASPSALPFAVRIADRKTLWRLLRDPLMEFGEAYSDQRLEVVGSLVECLTGVHEALVREQGLQWRLADWWPKRRPPRPNSLSGSRSNIHQHYDLGNDFYNLWLDRDLVYTCAYFAEPGYTLEQAQQAKLEHVCRKVWLRPGETVLETGCGWGGLALYAARHYGARVRAFNISHEQIVYARERARAEGLAHLVEFVEDDWRNASGRYDVFLSVGMLEHVGVENYQALGQLIRRSLQPRGRALLHSITQETPRPLNPWITQRIFPGAYPPTLRQMCDIFEPNDLSVLDLENLRMHYAVTLRHWLARFEAHRDTIARMFDERFVRMWRLYLAGSAAAFDTGGLRLFQVVCAPIDHRAVPRSRAYLYAQDPRTPGVPAPPAMFGG